MTAMTVKHRRRARARRFHPAACPEVATMAPVAAVVEDPAPRLREVTWHKPDPARCAVAYICTWKPVLDGTGGQRVWRSFAPDAFDQFFTDEQMIANLKARLGKPVDLPPVYIGHGNRERYPRWSEPVGRWVQFRKDDHGLIGIAEFDDTDDGALALQLVWTNAWPGWSGHFGITDEHDAGIGRLVLPSIEVTESALLHAGPVDRPADPGAVTIWVRNEFRLDRRKHWQAWNAVADLAGWAPMHNAHW